VIVVGEGGGVGTYVELKYDTDAKQTTLIRKRSELSTL